MSGNKMATSLVSEILYINLACRKSHRRFSPGRARIALNGGVETTRLDLGIVDFRTTDSRLVGFVELLNALSDHGACIGTQLLSRHAGTHLVEVLDRHDGRVDV